MRQSFKIIINTISLYAKIIISAIVTLFSTRIVLHILGVESFGLYNLIAGVIVLLSFFNGALIVSSQRFISIAIGENNKTKLSKIFSMSILIHIILAFILSILLKTIQPFLFNGFLKIDPTLISTAIRVYDIMIISAFVTVCSIPYSAAINAREEMWFYSISEVFVTILKLGAAVYLLYAKNNYLYMYTLLMLIAIIAGLIINYIWCRFRYKECRINLNHMLDYDLFKEMIGFASWNTLGSVAMVSRNQGIAIALNIFFGTVVNAAYGIANQLNSLVITFASTLTLVFTPMIISEKGKGNNEKMLFVSIFSSKVSFFLSSSIALPILMYTQYFLYIWLNEVPEYTSIFCQILIISFLILQIYPGITRGLYAEGNIKWYQIIISIILVAIIPIGILLFHYKMQPYSIMIVLLVAQIITLTVTVYFANIKINLNINHFYTHSVFLPIILLIMALTTGYTAKMLIVFENQTLEVILISFIMISLFSFSYYKIVLNTDESYLLKNLIRNLYAKLRK